MKLLLLVCSLYLLCCNQPLKAVQTAATNDSVTENFATYYVAIADTGTSYYKLRSEAARLNAALHITIDTMGRHYDKQRHKIVLADDDEDEIYRGEYYPRRETDTTGFLSLEYYEFYSGQPGERNIALVAGIFEQRKTADALLEKIKPVMPGAFIKKAKVYTGCMH